MPTSHHLVAEPVRLRTLLGVAENVAIRALLAGLVSDDHIREAVFAIVLNEHVPA